MTVENILDLIDDCYVNFFEDSTVREILSSKDDSLTAKEYNNQLNKILNKEVVGLSPCDEYEMNIYIKM